jgi:hypothetical protein
MPAGSTYECIESKVLASSTTTVTFSSIPNTYTDLILIMQPSAGSPNGNAMRMRLNGNSESVYSATFLDGTGSSLVSARTGTIAQMDLGWRVGIDSSAINQTYYMHFLNYKNTNTFKPILWSAGGVTQATDLVSGLWRKTDAINSISITIGMPSSTNFNSGSTFTLYGIGAA